MDELIYLIDNYVMNTPEPSLMGLRVYLYRRSDGDFKDAELHAKLQLYLEWLILEERYEECTYVHQIIKEHGNRSI